MGNLRDFILSHVLCVYKIAVRSMVKLLRLCVDYGEEKILAAIGSLSTPELTVAQIQAHLMPTSIPETIPTEIDIKVSKPEFERYDALIHREVAI